MTVGRSLIFGFALASALHSARADDILEPGFKLKKLVGDCKFAEGPAVDAKGNLFFSDGPNDRIMQRTPDGVLSVFRQRCGRVNGMTFDRNGNLVMCQAAGPGGLRRVSKIDGGNNEAVLLDEYDGKRLNAPNDVTVDAKNRVFFTDISPVPAGDKETLGSAVYRVDKPLVGVRVISDLQRPNGIVATPDGKLLYVSDRGTQKLHRYLIQEDGSLRPDGVVYDFAPDRGIDGMRLDVQGNIYACAGDKATTGLYVISPQGKLLVHHPLPEFATNLAFGGDDNKDLHLTATTSVYLLRTVLPGATVGKRGK